MKYIVIGCLIFSHTDLSNQNCQCITIYFSYKEVDTTFFFFVLFVFFFVFFFLLPFSIYFFSENLSLDENLTRHKITTVLENPVNLGCYVTNLTHISKTLTFVWMKDNTTVTQSAALSIHGNVLVVTPKSGKDFGVYNCEVTNGVSKTRCQITLVQGWKKSGKSCKLTNFINIYFTPIRGQLKALLQAIRRSLY